MPAPKPPASSGISSFLKSNAKFAYGGGIGIAMLGLDAKAILDSDNKMKALLKTFKDFVLIRVAMVGIFTAVQQGIKSLVRDTGSLDQALKKLGQMQIFSRSLATFVGGLQAARQRIAALSQLSEKSPFKFEELATANKSLEVFTRGAYSSVEATKEIGLAAIATGSNITDVASVVGSLYDNLRSGQPIAQAAEQLRQMGIISQSTADHLVEMSEGGSDAASTFEVLTEAMKKTAAGAEGYKNELAGITEEHQKAIEVLQEKFASPFTAAETKNIENMTAAMKAITPTVGKVAGSLQVVFGGFNTARTSITKFVAESKAGQKGLEIFTYALEALSVAAVAFGVYAAGQLTPVIAKLGQSFVAMGGFAAGATIALRAVAIASVWLLVAQAIASVVGMVINYSNSVKQIKKDFHDWSEAQAEATKKLREQAAAIVTLADKNALLAASMKQIISLQKERQALDDKRKHLRRDEEVPIYRKDMRQLISYFSGAEEREKKLTDKKDKRAAKEIENDKKIMEDASHQETINKQIVDSEAERQFAIEQQTKGIEQRDREAKAGLEAQEKAEKPLGELEAKRVTVQAELDKRKGEIEDREKERPKAPTKVLEPPKGVQGSEFKQLEYLKYQADVVEYQKKSKEFDDAKIKQLSKSKTQEDEITSVLKQKQDIEMQAPEFSSTYRNARAEQLRQAKQATIEQITVDKLRKEKAEPAKIQAAEIRLERAKTLAGPEGIKTFAETGERGLRKAEVAAEVARKAEAARPSGEDIRRQQVERLQIQTDIRGRDARARGDIKTAQAMEDLSTFSHHAEQLMGSGFSKQEALVLAGEETRADITEQYAGRQQPVGAIQTIGGGGNLPGVDASLEIARRQETLQQKMVDYLAILSGSTEEKAAQPPTYQ
jgi:hypothetical protein